MRIAVINPIWSATTIYFVTELFTRKQRGNYGHFWGCGHLFGDRNILNDFMR
jgi:hypothetical protein